jgi:hypothetical protein
MKPKHISWIFACAGFIVGFIVGRVLIGFICALGGYILFEMVMFMIRRSAEAKIRQENPKESQYTPEQWEEYKKTLHK